MSVVIGDLKKEIQELKDQIDLLREFLFLFFINYLCYDFCHISFFCNLEH